jgi:LysR family transcriptional regulator, transcriptional activator of nhaA
MDWLNYHQLMNFWLVAREGSVQRASELLHVTPSSVSIQIRQLERALGVKLFNRRGRGLILTDIGQQVAEYATDIFATGRELMDLVRGRPLGRPMELRIGIRDVMPKLVAFNLIKPAFGLAEPPRIVCQEGEMAKLIADLAIHKLDVVLSDTPLDPLYRLQAYSHLLGEAEIGIMGVPELAAAYRRGFPNSLQDAPFLLPTDTSVLRRALDQWFHDMAMTPKICGEFADSAMLKIAGSTGLGLFAVPTTIRRQVENMYGVEWIGAIPSIRERYYAVSVERKLKHPAVVAISQAARDHSGKC